MAYKKKIIEEAFGLYCSGISFEAVADEMRKRHPEECKTITRHTISKWEEKFNWDARREVIETKARTKADAKRISARAELINEMELLQERLLNQTQGMVLKSLEGGVNAAISLSRFILNLKGDWGKDGGRLNQKQLDNVIMIIFEVLAEDEKMGRFLEERQDFILTKIQERLESTN